MSLTEWYWVVPDNAMAEYGEEVVSVPFTRGQLWPMVRAEVVMDGPGDLAATLLQLVIAVRVTVLIGVRPAGTRGALRRPVQSCTTKCVLHSVP